MDALQFTLRAWWIDWQQTAIANTRYSVAIIFATALLSILLMVFWHLQRRKLWQHKIDVLNQANIDLNMAAERTTAEFQQKTEQMDQTLQQQSEKIDIEQQGRLDAIRQKLELEHALNEQQATTTALQNQLAEIQNRLAESRADNTLLLQQLEEKPLPADVIHKLDEYEQQHQQDLKKINELMQEKTLMTTMVDSLQQNLQQMADQVEDKKSKILELEQQRNQTAIDSTTDSSQDIASEEMKKLESRLREAETKVIKADELDACIHSVNEKLEEMNLRLQSVLKSTKVSVGHEPGLLTRIKSMLRWLDYSVDREPVIESVSLLQSTTAKWELHHKLVEELLQQLQPIDAENKHVI